MPEHVKVSFPKDLYGLIKQGYGEDQAQKICDISNEQPMLTVRANTMRSTRPEVIKVFKDMGWSVKPT